MNKTAQGLAEKRELRRKQKALQSDRAKKLKKEGLTHANIAHRLNVSWTKLYDLLKD